MYPGTAKEGGMRRALPPRLADYGAHLVVGDHLLARDKKGQWGKAKVVQVPLNPHAQEPAEPQSCSSTASSIRVHFAGWDARFDETISLQSDRLRPTLISRSTLGQAACGWRVRVQWDKKVWYHGEVTRFEADSQRHLIRFDDGDSGWYHVDHEESEGLLEWCDGTGEHASSAGRATNKSLVTSYAQLPRNAPLGLERVWKAYRAAVQQVGIHKSRRPCPDNAFWRQVQIESSKGKVTPPISVSSVGQTFVNKRQRGELYFAAARACLAGTGDEGIDPFDVTDEVALRATQRARQRAIAAIAKSKGSSSDEEDEDDEEDFGDDKYLRDDVM
jgi:hypothetical protein